MAQEVTVDFGSFVISSYLDTSFVLTVSTSILLYVPVQCSNISTAADLRDQVQTGSLWIARAGSCHIELGVGFGLGSFKHGSEASIQRMSVEAFERFPVWGALGLDLRRAYNQFNELRGSRSLYPYSVQHQQQNFGLIAPDQVPCAYLSKLSCNFIFGSKSSLGGISQNNTLVNLALLPRGLQENAAAKQRPRGSAEKYMPPLSKSKIITLKAPPGDLRKILGVPEICSLPMDLQAQRLEHLTHTALHLVVGSRKRFSGIIFLKKPGSPTALEIAPAVWSSRYFQDVVSRAKLACFVSSALGSLMKTESPDLRHKIQTLGFDTPQDIQRRMLLLVLRSARVPKPSFQMRPNGSKSQFEAGSVVADDEIYHSHESKEGIEGQELYGKEHNDQSIDESLIHDETMVVACSADPDLADKSISAYRYDSEVDEELVLPYGTPHLGQSESLSRSSLQAFDGSSEFANEQLLDGTYIPDRNLYGTQDDDDLEFQDGPTVKSMHEEYADDNMEEPVGLTFHNFEHSLFHDGCHRHGAISDTQAYVDVDSEHFHQACSGTQTDGESHQAYQQRLYEFEDSEDLEDQRSEGHLLKEKILIPDSSDFSLHSEVDQSQFQLYYNLMDANYDADSIDCARDQSLGQFGECYLYEDVSMHQNDGFTDEDAASTATGLREFNEIESVLIEPHGDEAECNCGGAEGEGKVPSEGAFMLCGADRYRSSTSSYYHQPVPDNFFDGEFSPLSGVPRQPFNTASSLGAELLSIQ